MSHFPTSKLAAVAAAGLIAAGAAQTAEAAIVYSGVQNITISGDANNFIWNAVTFDFEDTTQSVAGTATTGAWTSGATDYGMDFYGGGTWNANLGSNYNNASSGVVAQSWNNNAGTAISSLSLTSGSIPLSNGNTQYMVFRRADGTHGWVQVANVIGFSNSTDGNASLTIVDWAFETDTADDIAIAQAPEPGSLALLGLGGLALLRRRR
ncbi:MAG: PEP-CTERM sorting domain-containing protein [Planctomycetota bacterium]